MKCEKCGVKSDDQSQRCSNCGNSLSNVQCKSCKEWITKSYSVCPICGSTRHTTRGRSKQSIEIGSNHNHTSTNIANWIAIFLALIMIILMFSRVATFTYNSNISRKELPITEDYEESPLYLTHFLSSSVNGLSNYTIKNINDNEKDININSLSLYMLDEVNGTMVVRKSLVYINTMLLLTMILVPVTVLLNSIFGLSVGKRSNKNRTFFSIAMVLGFILMICLELLGLGVGPVIIMYIALAVIGLTINLIIELVEGKRSYRPKVLITDLITLIGLFILLIIGSNSIVNMDITSDEQTNISASYGDFTYLTSKFNGSGDFNLDSLLSRPLIMHLTTSNIRITHEWIMYLAVFIPILMVIVMGFIVASFSSFANKVSSVTLKRSRSIGYIWAAFIAEFITLILLHVVNVGFNDYVFNGEVATSGYQYFSGVEMSVAESYKRLMWLTFGVGSYKTIVLYIKDNSI